MKFKITPMKVSKRALQECKIGEGTLFRVEIDSLWFADFAILREAREWVHSKIKVDDQIIVPTLQGSYTTLSIL